MKLTIRPSLSRVPGILPLAAGLLVSSLAQAQGHEQWIPIQSQSEPGQPAVLTVDEGASNAQQTVLDLQVYGFWRTDVVGDDGKTYARLDFPGLGEIGQIGAPELPAMRPKLAIPTEASTASQVGEVLDVGETMTIPMVVYPKPTPAGDGGEVGIPEEFMLDEALYASAGAWPATQATDVAPVGLRFGSIPYAGVELFPARFDPAAEELVVSPHMRVVYDHSGPVQPTAPMTLDRELQCKATFSNWPSAGGSFAANEQTYEGRYLIVTPAEYLDELEEFVAYRKATGFQVTVKTLEELGFASCGEIRAMIDAWYALGQKQFDHYCLLVGDADVLPMCPSPNADQILGDDLYGSPSGLGDLDEEIYVGRVSVDDGADLVHQLGKVIAYETDQTHANDYGRVVLAAHKEQDPKFYADAHEAVANASYDVAPTFEKVYGKESWMDNDDVTELIEDGVGLVAYRGHGGYFNWSDWNYSQEFAENSWKTYHVGLLENDMLPVVWSFSCWNQNIDAEDSDCIGEIWMESANGGVAHYGSQEPSGTSKNHVLDAAMFYGVYELGLTTHGHAIEYGEAVMKDAYPGSGWQNEWMYFLLGDPAMKIRRMSAMPFELATQETLPVVGATAEGTFVAQVLDPETGTPIEGVQVSAYKAGPDGGDEVLANAYSDSMGQALLPSPKTLGDVMLSVRDREGNVTLTTVSAQAGAFVDLGDALAGEGGEPRLESDATLIPGTECKIELSNGMPFSLGALAVGSVDAPTALLGGIVHPFPFTTLVPVATDAAGDWDLTIPIWPETPSGAELVMQAAILDAGAPQGFALSNALLAVTP